VPARGAAEKRTGPDEAERRNNVADLGAIHRDEFAVADRASRVPHMETQTLHDEFDLIEQSQTHGQAKPAQLVAAENAALEEPPVAGDDDARFREGVPDEVAVGDIGGVRCIDAKGPQPAGEAAAHRVAGDPGVGIVALGEHAAIIGERRIQEATARCG